MPPADGAVVRGRRPGSFGGRPCKKMRDKLLAARAYETLDWSCLPPSWHRQWMVQRIIATVDWADFREIACVYDRAAYLTWYTGIEHQVDHIIPLNGGYICGLHCSANLEAIPKERNRVKSNGWSPDQMLLEIPAVLHTHQLALL